MYPKCIPAARAVFRVPDRHGFWEEGILDDTLVLQTQTPQPLLPREGSNPGIRAAPSLISGRGEAMQAIRSRTQKSQCGGVPHPGASSQDWANYIIVRDSYAISTSVHCLRRSAYLHLP